MRVARGRTRTAVSAGACALALAACGGSSHGSVRIRATPAVGLYDKARTIVISHLRDGEIVRVTASSPRQVGTWSATASFRTPRSGVIDLADQAPLSGSYAGVAPMGLFWSQRRTGSRSAPPNAMTVTTLTAAAGTRRLAMTRVTQRFIDPGVTRRDERVSTAGFDGQYFAPPGRARRPAVVVWGGSEGGLGGSPSEAALLASHGIPALALAYFDAPGLPCSLSDIPLGYFARAIRWLRAQPAVDPRRVWAMSASRGSEAALLVASDFGSLLHGVVVAAPSAEAYGSFPGTCQVQAGTAAWTLHGRPLPHARLAIADVTQHPDGSLSETHAFLAGLADARATRAARIPVGRIRGPVLLISGGEDQLWPSDMFADRIMAGLHGDRSPHVHLNFPRAGHVVLAIPYNPPFTQTASVVGTVDLGGTAAADEAAHERDWPAAIRFILTH